MKGADLAYDFRCQYLAHSCNSSAQTPTSTMAMNAAPTPSVNQSGSKASMGVQAAFRGTAPTAPFTNKLDSGASVGVRAPASTTSASQSPRAQSPSPKHRAIRVLDSQGNMCNPLPPVPNPPWVPPVPIEVPDKLHTDPCTAAPRVRILRAHDCREGSGFSHP
jgi:hypothetical protein